MLRILLIALALSATTVFAQDLEWSVINSDNSDLPNQTIKSIVVDEEGALWIGTYMGGIGVLKDDNWTIYNTSNSELPHNYINAIAIDKNNVKWVGTDGGGLARFDGTTWEVYKTSNSGIPSNVVMSIFCDDDGTIWVGTYFGGLAEFNSGIWTIYNDENSPLLSNKVVTITKDHNGLLWLGTQGGGVASFDRSNWNVYTERNSKLTNDYIYSIAVDKENKKWIGTGGGGLNVFNDVYWVKYNASTSNLTDDNIRPIAIDAKDNKWIGTYIGGINVFDGKVWKVYDFQNSQMPDDEITTMTYHKNMVYVGTERSGLVAVKDIKPVAIPVPVVAAKVEQKPEEPKVKEEIVEQPIEVVKEVPVPVVIEEEIQPKEPEKEPIVEVQPEVIPLSAPSPQNQIVIVMDAADVYFDPQKRKDVIRAFAYLLKHRERINASYEVRVLIYSTNYDVSPRKITLTEAELEKLSAKDVIFLEGESTFTEGIKKAFNLIKVDYNPNGNNHVIAATYKFIRDDETAKVVVKDNLDNNYIVFSLLAFDTDEMKLRRKMREIVPRGNGHYYAINKPGLKDNWSVTGQFGLSVFRGDIDKSNFIGFPGVFGIAANKQLLSTGMINGGVKAQFNVGKLTGEKNNESFKNNYIEGCINFQVILNRWINRNFRFDKYRPYAFAGIGFINYRALLWNNNGDVINGIGYDVIEDDIETNGSNPNKTSSVTEIIFPVGAGVNYKLNENFNVEVEASSRFINSDQLDARIGFKNDKYWFFSVGVTYKFQSKEFMADILNK
ncbi:MAG: outer membrane beta-barrel protein [Bacteroidetes bacterium]|nr:outer membrane beta-barrel protein [Bacteroidota bacterium]